jgi:hypothetical protein
MTWICPRCREGVSTIFARNLGLLVDEHKASCVYNSTSRESAPLRPLTQADQKFLQELKVGW